MINLKEKIEEIISRITAEPLSFKKLATTGSKSEVVVLFLAILHLIRQQIIEVNQNGHFEEITIARKAINA